MTGGVFAALCGRMLRISEKIDSYHAQIKPKGQKGWALTAHKTMITILKLFAAGVLGVAILNPGFGPRMDTCECEADAIAKPLVPHAEDCECKAKAD